VHLGLIIEYLDKDGALQRMVHDEDVVVAQSERKHGVEGCRRARKAALVHRYDEIRRRGTCSPHE
ncbi:unnamed protein product, partial [Ectocarpus sp. 13 AM-2016]